MDTSLQLANDGASRAKVPPKLTIALGVFVGYVVLVLVLSRISGIEYDELTATADNFRDGLTIPIGVVAVVLAVVASVLGWWHPSMVERPSVPRWMLLLPAVGLVALPLDIALSSKLDDFGGEWLFYIFVGMAFVGFSEELMTRGILLVGFRAEHREVFVWLGTSLLFGLMHGINALNGQGLGATLQQVFFTAIIGTFLYIARRASGLLVVSMALHALIDTTIVIHGGPGQDLGAGGGGPAGVVIFQLVAVVVTLVGFRLLFRPEVVMSVDEVAA